MGLIIKNQELQRDLSIKNSQLEDEVKANEELQRDLLDKNSQLEVAEQKVRATEELNLRLRNKTDMLESRVKELREQEGSLHGEHQADKDIWIKEKEQEEEK